MLDFVDGELKMVLVGGLKRALNDPSTDRLQRRAHRRRRQDGGLQGHDPARRRAERHDPATCSSSFEPVEQSERAAPRQPRRRSTWTRSRASSCGALEAELAYTKENLQAAIEELETSNEELQASNEELQASNEELQSTNEELQSVNEELYTVNAEYQRKIAELTELTNDMDNLLASTDVGTIFLDRSAAHPQVHAADRRDLQPVPHDVGRLDRDVRPQDRSPGAGRRPQAGARRRATPIERELRDLRRPSRSSCASCRTARRGRSTAWCSRSSTSAGSRQAEDALFHERYLLNSLLQTSPTPSTSRTRAGRFIRANEAMAARLGLQSAGEAMGKTAFELPDHAAALAHAPDRTRSCCAPARPSTTASRRRVPADGRRGVGPGHAAAAARPRRTASSASSASSAT